VADHVGRALLSAEESLPAGQANILRLVVGLFEISPDLIVLTLFLRH
jgi:hypothetical protein